MTYNLENLTKLADYLTALPDDYPSFDMRNYFMTRGRIVGPDTPDVHIITATDKACAIGHGPAAGLPREPHEHTWSAYSLRVFGGEVYGPDEDFSMVFGQHPRHHHQVAAQIRKLVRDHTPIVFGKTRMRPLGGVTAYTVIGEVRDTSDQSRYVLERRDLWSEVSFLFPKTTDVEIV